MAKKIPSEISKPQSLRVLVVEDSEDDVLLIIRELKKGGYDPVYERVETEKAISKALKEKQWDVILCDYKLPKFNVTSAIALLKETNIDIPLIIVSGTIGEETAIECMRLGAQDYIMKDNLSRLVPAIERGLKEAESRVQRKQAEEALRQGEEKYRTILKNIEDGYYEVDLNGNFTFFNDSMCRILGYSQEEMMGMNNRQFTEKENAKKLFKTFNEVYRTGQPAKEFDWQIIRKDGTNRYIETSISLHKDSSGKLIGFRGIIRDITERKQAAETLRESEKYFKEITENSSDIIIITDKKGDIKYCSRSVERFTGYRPEELIGRSVLTLIHPDDKKRAVDDFGKAILATDSAIPNAFRIMHKDGSERYFEGLGKNLLNNPAVAGFIMNVRDITERMQAEKSLQRSEGKYRTILEDMQEGYFEIDLKGNFTFINDAECKNLGYSREELIGMNNRQYTNEENAKKAFQAFSNLYKTGESCKIFDYEVTRKDGTKAIAELLVSLVKDSNGKPIGFRGLSRQITERKRMEDELRRSEEKYRTIIENMQEFYFEDDLAGNLTFVNDALCRSLGYTRKELIGMNYKQYTEESNVKKLNELYGSLLKTGEPVASLDIEAVSKDGKKIIYDTSVSLIKNAQGKPVGFRGVARDVTERNQIEEVLRQSEEKYRTIIETMQDGYFETDLAGNFTFVNDSLCKIHGYPREELMGMNDKQYADEENAKKVFKFFNKIYRTGESGKIFDNEIIRKDGTKRQIEVSGSLKKDSLGNPTGFRGITRDITERKRAEEVLRESEEKYRTILETIQEGYFEIDLAGNFTFVNDAQCKITGTPREQLLGKNNRDYSSEEEAKRLYQIYSRIYRTGEPEKGYAFEFTRRDGTKAFHEVSASLIRDARGKPIGFRGVSRDVTERKQMEETLRQSEERYRTIIETMEDGYWETDLPGNFTFVNDAECKIAGTPKEQLIGRNNQQYTDKTTAKRLYEAFKEIYKTGEPVKNCDFEFIRRNGTRAFAEFSASLIRDAQGKPTGFRGVTRDVTERKQAEETLAKSEEKYRTIIENIQDGYFEIDLTGKFTFVNDAECNNLGYTREELIEMGPARYAGEKNRKPLINLFIEIYKTGIPVKAYNLELTKKDGTQAYNEISVSLIRNSKGESIGFRGIARDVTERKRAEDERKQSFERLRKALGATVHSISVIVEMKDPYTSGHQQRVSDLARSIATEMGLSTEQRDFIRTASAIHDIGKIAIPSEILSKPTKLTDLEFNMIKTHAQSGYDILKDIEFPWPVADVVLQHHERMDGSGYPHGLKGDDILLEARILAIADVVEAIASHRPYRPAFGIEVALEEIEKNKGILYDNTVAAACLRLFREKSYQFP